MRIDSRVAEAREVFDYKSLGLKTASAPVLTKSDLPRFDVNAWHQKAIEAFEKSGMGRRLTDKELNDLDRRDQAFLKRALPSHKIAVRYVAWWKKILPTVPGPVTTSYVKKTPRTVAKAVPVENLGHCFGRYVLHGTNSDKADMIADEGICVDSASQISDGGSESHGFMPEEDMYEVYSGGQIRHYVENHFWWGVELWRWFTGMSREQRGLLESQIGKVEDGDLLWKHFSPARLFKEAFPGIRMGAYDLGDKVSLFWVTTERTWGSYEKYLVLDTQKMSIFGCFGDDYADKDALVLVMPADCLQAGPDAVVEILDGR